MPEVPNLKRLTQRPGIDAPDDIPLMGVDAKAGQNPSSSGLVFVKTQGSAGESPQTFVSESWARTEGIYICAGKCHAGLFYNPWLWRLSSKLMSCRKIYAAGSASDRDP